MIVFSSLKNLFFISSIALVFLVLFYKNAITDESTIDFLPWFERNLEIGDNVICSDKINDDYFFLAKGPNGLKTGAMIYTGQGNLDGNYIESFIVSWSFYNSKGSSLAQRTVPKVLKSGTLKENGKLFSENISIRYLYQEHTSPISVYIEVEKYSKGTSIPQNIEELEEGNGLKKTKLCDVM